MEKKDLEQYTQYQFDIAKKIGIPVLSVQVSKRKDKKYVITLDDGSQINYGSVVNGVPMGDFLIHRDERRRQNFHKRFSKSIGYNNPKSSLFYSRYLLW